MKPTCPNCGGKIEGDGYTIARHCETVGVPAGIEPDANTIYCGQKRVIRLHNQASKYSRAIEDILQDITKNGYTYTLDPEHNPITYWIYTDCPIELIRRLPGVFDCI